MNNNGVDQVSDILEPAHFYAELHGEIYAEILRLTSIGKQAIPPAMTGRFDAHDLVEIADCFFGTHSNKDYAKTIKAAFDRRRIIEIAEEMRDTAVSQSVADDVDEIRERAETELFALSSTSSTMKPVTVGDAASETIHQISERMDAAKDGRITGVASGLIEVDKRLGGFQPSDLVIIAGRPSMGKELRNSEPILMSDGSFKPIGDVKVGDELASIDGKKSIVTGVFPQGKKMLYRINFTDGREVVAGADHQWEIGCRHWDEPRVLTTLQIMEKLKSKRYQKRMFLPDFSGDFGVDTGIDIDPYVLGVLLGDGSFASKSQVRLTTSYQHILDRISGRLKGSHISNSGGIEYRLIGGNILSKIRQFGLSRKKSSEKFIPDQYMQTCKQTRLELLRGLLDTDGWVEKGSSIVFSSASKVMADQVASLVRSLGGWASQSVKKSPKYLHNGEEKTGQDSHKVYISGPEKTDYVTIPHKLDRLSKPDRRKRVNIASVEVMNAYDECTCISVSHDRALYICGDYIPTHNTALMLSMATYAANDTTSGMEDSDGAVLVFSLEMSKHQLVERIFANVADVSYSDIVQGNIDQETFQRLHEYADRMRFSKMVIDDRSGATVARIRSEARRVSRKVGLKMIVVDYLGFMKSSEAAGERHDLKVAQITAGLKSLAKEMNIPIVLLSQLSRQVEQREDKRPMLSDLRDSGAIEQDADVVMFVYREQYYLERAEPSRRNDEAQDKFADRYARWQSRLNEVQGTADVIIGKARRGKVGSVRCAFNGDRQRFSNLAYDGD
jgi:replicative DNA helicase